MKLVVHEMVTSLSQPLTPEKNTNVSAVRPHIYIHNSPIGTLKVQIKTADGEVLGESSEISFSEITSANYFHGYVRFNVSAYLMKNVEYVISVVAGGGYAFSESSFCGVCNDFDLRKYDPSFTPSGGLNAPLDMEVWALSSR